MNALTPKQRESIYLHIAYNYPTFQSRYLCNALKLELTLRFNIEYGEGYGYTFIAFPEFELSRQTEDESSYEDGWFDSTDERITCMLLCAEMCKP